MKQAIALVIALSVASTGVVFAATQKTDMNTKEQGTVGHHHMKNNGGMKHKAAVPAKQVKNNGSN